MSERLDALSWVHFGDLHLQREQDENYLDFLDLIGEANDHLASTVDFAFLPGDNADDGTAEQYRLLRPALNRLKLPVKIITGDHDRKAGTLDCFREYLEPEVFRSERIRNFGLLFLNAMDGADQKTFDIGEEQWTWLTGQLKDFRESGLRPIVFTHLYPSELRTRGEAFSDLLRQHGVELVEMGHTHYNELANDGRIVYAATRSTGQIEEGPPGFSMTVIDGDVISWKFKPLGAWPMVMITSPSDYRLITDGENPHHVLRQPVEIRARVWDGRGVLEARCSIDGAPFEPMQRVDELCWQMQWNPARVGDGVHSIRVEASANGHAQAHDEIWALVKQCGDYKAPPRSAVDFENTVGAWPEKGILGTELGPNENGTKGPWPSWRKP
jgi:Icc protein